GAAWLAAPARVKALSVVGLLSAGLATAACLIPPPAVQDVVRFELNLLGSVVAMLAVGLALYVAAGFNR
ncbi:MAG: hypothetical protein HOP19_10190, partial [Acidobacteria bacterium]|nr:hypothetical protein [Acidobacteriota bacterium]